MYKVLEPITIGSLELKNRLVMAPMAVRGADSSDHVTAKLVEYYRERAAYSGVGLIITEHAYVTMQGKAHPQQVSIADDSAIPGLRAITDAIHRCGVKVFAQISHAGSATYSGLTGLKSVGPSTVPHPRNDLEIPAALMASAIHELTTAFVAAARRAVQAGYDGVEVHSAHGYLLNQFYSPLTNVRQDEYGSQSVAGRTRLQCEILEAIRREFGPGLPLSIRLGGSDYVPGGSTIADCVEACRLFKKSGADIVSLTGGMYGFDRPGHDEPGWFQDMSRAVEENVDIPVLLTGGIRTLAQANSLVMDGCADLIGIGRALMRDAHWIESSIGNA